MTQLESKIYQYYSGLFHSDPSLNTPQNVKIHEISNRYDAIFFDAFGTLYAHHQQVYPGSLSMFHFLRKQKKQLRLITNAASQSKEKLCLDLNKMGFDFSLQEIFSSGELFIEINQLLKYSSVFYIGNESGKSFLKQAGITDFRGEDVCVVIASVPENETLLEKAIKILSEPQGHLIVLNPDAYAPRIGGERIPVTGTYAYQLLSQTNCKVSYCGKPFPQIFQNALQSLAPKSRTLMIGDTLGTDILGAHAAGIDSALIPGRNMDPETLTRDEEFLQLRPTYYLSP